MTPFTYTKAKYRLTEPYCYSKAPFVFPKFEGGTYRVAGFGATIQADAGYEWDGPSGPTLDTSNAIRASLIHDILYQAIHEGHLPRSYRRRADKVFRRILKEDGMSMFRRWLWYRSVRWFGGAYV